ncbi:uracil-DNA glycosylase [Alteromonas sp.]|uniref:uracil-DNA glycosylase n=1 Tax=Alteromonas sp. TaxID=232 RepID=UPI000B625BB9|nr:uracil-DNA glycosylase [Alteromonas sp.]MAI38624.1 uracil-DNA glycosylase [Alteromonas sp.]OUX85571.1 MAG: uracil-DNA glycosylase [Alteromonas sp. TMED35]|tara:strand:+ start:45625 stop:46284 length:660 start_codon:yes stop_codon:yes gene_type:complete
MMTWTEALAPEKATPYFRELMLHVQAEREAGKVIYPPKEDVFNAFAMTALEDIRVVILGQDPYHGPHQAHGLCFSVLPGVKIPPSLRNIYKELADDIDGFSIPNHGTLSPWAEQGVLLLNTVLTVEQGKAHSHAKLGWETFTDKVIEVVNQHCSDVVFLLWGSHAQKKGNTINREKHHVLHAPHPSPLSAHRGFFGSKPFSQTNQLLVESGKAPIQWQV